MKKAILATAVAMAATGVMADDWKHRDDGFSNWNDVEINFDVNRLKNRTEGNNIPADDSIRIGDDSRLLVAGQWRASQENGNFVTAVGEALLQTTGNLAMDDAFFAFGNKDNWFLQIGRFEAMDLFPLGKDVAYSPAIGSDYVNDVYDTNKLYVYTGAEARGRGESNSGQARAQAEIAGFTAEVSTTFGQTNFSEDNSGTDFNGQQDNSFMIRPAVSFATDDGFLNVTLGGEWEARKSSLVVDQRANGDNIHSSDRYGLAATTTMQLGPLAWHVSGAYQNIDKFRKAYSVNSNVEFLEQWGAGFTYARNNYHSDYKNEITDYKNPNGYVVYGAYTMPLLGFDNAEVTFGLSYAQTSNRIEDGARSTDKDNDLMFRTRFNYYF